MDAHDPLVAETVRRGSVSDAELAAMPLAAGFDEIWRDLLDRAEPAPVRRTGRWRRVALAGVAGAVIVAGAGAAAAGVYQAHTGVTISDDGDRSELLNVNAPDFLTVARQYAEGVQFAPGYSADMYWGVIVSPDGVPLSDPETMSADGVRSYIRTWASCSWQRTWLAARASGDTAAKAAAAGQVEAFAADPLLSRFDSFQPKYAKAVADDDAAVIQTSVTMGCPVPSPAVTR